MACSIFYQEDDRSLRNVDQRPKSREDHASQPRVEKSEDTIPKEKKPSSTEERFFHESRREELDGRASKRSQDFQGDARAASHPEKQEKGPIRDTVKSQMTELSEGKDKVKEKVQQVRKIG
jgi:hypothetical protein